MKNPTRPTQCETCIFRTDGNQTSLAPGRLQEIKAYLIKGVTHYCHTDKHLACRGGRQFQAEMWHLMRILSQPTIEALERKAAEYQQKSGR